MVGKKRVVQLPINTGDAATNQTTVIKDLFNALHSTLVALGLVNTSDTGQLDINAIALTTGSVSQDFGYKIYRFADSLATESPVFIKFIFGHVSYSYSDAKMTKMPNLKIQIGTGSNGSGVLTSPTEVYSLYSAGTGGGYPSNMLNTGNYPSYFYHGEGVLWVALMCGGVKNINTGSTIPRPTTALPYALHHFVIVRPCDSGGDVQPHKVALLMNPNISYMAEGYRFDSAIPRNYFFDLRTNMVRQSRRILSRPCADTSRLINGSIPIARAYGYFGGSNNILEQLTGIGSVNAVNVSSEDTTNIALNGIVEKEFICPYKGLLGFDELYGKTIPDGSELIDTPMLLWDGDFV